MRGIEGVTDGAEVVLIEREAKRLAVESTRVERRRGSVERRLPPGGKLLPRQNPPVPGARARASVCVTPLGACLRARGVRLGVARPSRVVYAGSGARAGKQPLEVREARKVMLAVPLRHSVAKTAVRHSPRQPRSVRERDRVARASGTLGARPLPRNPLLGSGEAPGGRRRCELNHRREVAVIVGRDCARAARENGAMFEALDLAPRLAAEIGSAELVGHLPALEAQLHLVPRFQSVSYLG